MASKNSILETAPSFTFSIASSKLLLSTQANSEHSSSSEGEVEDYAKIQSSTKWFSQGKNYNLDRKQKFVETTIGIHFEGPKSFKTLLQYTLDEHGQLYFWFMLVVCLAAIYNFVTVPMRIAYANIPLFPASNVSGRNPILLDDNLSFYIMDILTDIIYLADIFLCQNRLQFVSKVDGYRIDSFTETLRRYLKTHYFWVDVISVVIPFVDFIQYFFPHFNQHYFRILRLLKILRVLQFGSLIERKFSFAQTFRKFKVVLQVLLLSNLVGSAFYLFYRVQGNENNGIFRNFEVIERDFSSHPMLFSFYWGFVMITNIHNQGRPSNSGQYVFMIVIHFLAALNMAYLYAVFVSSLRIQNWQRNQFLVKSQRAKQIFPISKIPRSDPYVKKAERYFEYGYDHRIDVLEKTILTYFPKKLGLNVYKKSYYDIITEPEIFKKMSQSFFHYLIPRMEYNYYLPGEWIYKYNDVAKEMFIITKGGVRILEQLGSSEQILPTVIEKGGSFGFKELFAEEQERLRTGDAITIGFVHCLVILRRDLDIITKTYLSETDREQMKKNMESVKSKFLDEKLKHASNRKWSKVDTLNNEEQIRETLMQALKKIEILLRLRDHILPYVVYIPSDSDEDSNLGESYHSLQRQKSKSLQRRKTSTRSSTLSSIAEFRSEFARAPKMKFLSRQRQISDSDA